MPLPYFNTWPSIQSAVKKDPATEVAISNILSQMTLAEKVGQMIQPDLREVTPEEAEQYKLGSILNGGGAWPNGDKYASPLDWAKESDKYYEALERAYEGRGFRIPFAWATDAVHGHNNVFTATLFPHNIGLGAANNPDLIERIGAATALEISTTGLDWTFAPTVAVPRDYRWGRVYEGYSEDPQITYQYAKHMVKGLQGDLSKGLATGKVISTVKHWVGDGGTTLGVDRGENHYSEENLINIHAPGYFSALAAGAQVVMTSFNSWHNDNNYDVIGNGGYNYKLHGSKYIVNDVLKEKMGFDGIVVTDWNGHSEISGCTSGNCPQAVLAGNDIFMVTARKDWQQFYDNVITQVEAGIIPMSRIDDAITRILRVKMRAGLWDAPKPSERPLAGDNTLLGADKHRAIAREAVRESLVLLKNANNILPLAKDQNYLVVGSGANNIQKQTGGWSLTWQGDENEIDRDFPGATTLLSAFRKHVGSENVFTEISSAPLDAIAIVVMGEDPYAEMMGDIKRSKTLEYSSLKRTYAADLQLLKDLKQRGFKTVSVFYSGRPLYVNEEIQLSDAFIAAWLPGTEGGGITDVLFAEAGLDFKGRLSFSWPATKCGNAVNRLADHIPNYTIADNEQDPNGDHAPLFPYGYGLSYDSAVSSDLGIDANNIELDTRDYECGLTKETALADEVLELYGATADADFEMLISGMGTDWQPVKVSKGTRSDIGALTTTPIDYKHQQDAIEVKFDGTSPAQLYVGVLEGDTFDARTYLNANSSLEFDIDLKSAKPNQLTLAMHCEWPCLGEISLVELLPEPSSPEDTNWTTVKVPLSLFSEKGMEFDHVSAPFLIYSEQAVTFNLGNVRFVPGK
jgi:beta-glucosidase